MRLAWVSVGALLFGLLGSCESGCRHAPADTLPDHARSQSEDALRQRLQAAVRAKGASYVPRTRHHNPDGTPKYTNRLILESSPYLLQHAHNPVDWFAWGPIAFERARALQLPIFLSVGYSTCHWCHVMEEESFEDEEIARYLNQHYVAIKVDREERPDVDSTYMAFLQAYVGGGGWPMNVWLTPAREPFFGGTYFPPRAGIRGAREGLLDLLLQQFQAFRADPQRVAGQAHELTERLSRATAPAPAGDYPSPALLVAAARAAAQRFDPLQGGARGAPKFPSSFPVRLLLRVARRANDPEARRMALFTLDHMRAGGIYDQLGGGFHRYATDPRWRVPHFEKMLYDNALLAIAYLEAAQSTGDARYLRTVRETLDYLQREMRAPDATFYSATDADSPTPDGRREEGRYFTWTPDELRAALGDADARAARAWFDVGDRGEVDGRSVLRRERPLEAVAAELAQAPAMLETQLAQLRARLLAERTQRPPPFRDEKVVVANNGLTLSAFARAAIVLGDARYADAALELGRRLVATIGARGVMPHQLVNGTARGQAFSDDYALLAAGLLDLFELSSDPSWLTRAIELMEVLESSFADPVNGGYYSTGTLHESLLFRDKPSQDGPTPSVSSVAALNWLRLYAFTDDDRYRQRAEQTVRASARSLTEHPLALDQMLLALDWASDAAMEILIVVPDCDGALSRSARPLLDVLAHSFVPNSVLLVATEATLQSALATRVSWTRGKKLENGHATGYVCERGSCKLPSTEPAVFAAQLSAARAYP